MKMKVFVSMIMVVLLSLSFSNISNAQWGGGHGGGYHHGGGAGIRIVVPPLVRNYPPPHYYDEYRNYSHQRNYGYSREVYERGHHRRSDRAYYGDGYSGGHSYPYDRSGQRDRGHSGNYRY